MRRLLGLVLVLFVFATPAFADSRSPGRDAGCAERTLAAERSAIQLAQSDCRGNCSSQRGYCTSTCRDSQCRAICNDSYQRCLSSCRR